MTLNLGNGEKTRGKASNQSERKVCQVNPVFLVHVLFNAPVLLLIIIFFYALPDFQVAVRAVLR